MNSNLNTSPTKSVSYESGGDFIREKRTAAVKVLEKWDKNKKEQIERVTSHYGT